MIVEAAPAVVVETAGLTQAPVLTTPSPQAPLEG
jgi:hypothetical protein